MGQVLHGSAKTTYAIRAEIFRSDFDRETSQALRGQPQDSGYKTVVKWKNRDSAEDRKSGPEPKSTVLSREEEAIIVAFRRHTLIGPDPSFH